MEAARGNRKVLPNYLLDDYVPASDSKAASSNGTQAASLQATSAGTSYRHAESGSAGGEYASDSGAGPLASLPRRKKKLRQACVYCRRSHLVCEEKRPCHRCVKRGIADRCVDPPTEAYVAQDTNWTGTDAKSGADANKDAFISAPPAADGIARPPSSRLINTEASGSDAGVKRKRKAKSEAVDASATWLAHIAENAESRSEQHRPQSAFEFANALPTHATAQSHVQTIPTSNATEQSSTLRHSIPSHDSLNSGLPLPIQTEPAAATRIAPSQVLQVQPIFQPPSSAELDSLFSSYFFDVADSFNARQSSSQQQQMHPGHPIGQANPMYNAAQQQSHQAPAPQRHGAHQHHHLHQTQSQDANQNVSLATGAEQRASDGSSASAMALQHQQQHPYRQPGPANINGVPLERDLSSSHTTLHNAMSSCNPTRMSGTSSVSSGKGQAGLDGKALASRQKPGDVYAPYPYRKGYASLMRYMVEQNWSEQSIKSVEAALSKVRRLWFSLEDNIQPSSMIQLQAEWAGNVRYFSESVLPFAPVPMVVCRKAGEVYSSNQLAQELCGRSRDQMTGGKISCYELMTENSASQFFRLYERAVGGMQAADGNFVPTAASSTPLYWNAEILRPNADGTFTVLPTRGIFEMKIAPCGLPSLLVCCFVPLT